VLNAGAAIFVAGAAPDLGAGIAAAREAIASGAAADVLGRLVELSSELTGG
jgi:anthranilate phosphoribosyltransferase